MGKNKMKNGGAGVPKGAKMPSAYKSLEADGKPSPTDAKFQKAFGKAKDMSRKG